MKLSKLIAFSLLITLNAVASDTEPDDIAPYSLVRDYFDYCSEIRPDDENETPYILNCVNTQLLDSGFSTFSSYADLVAHKNKEDEQ